jgi:hypothetical protein
MLATPTKMWRMWDHNYNLIETWVNQPPPSSELIEGMNLTIDETGKQRWSGRVLNGEAVHTP